MLICKPVKFFICNSTTTELSGINLRSPRDQQCIALTVPYINEIPNQLYCYY